MYEQCRRIRNALLQQVSEIVCYTHWSDKFCVKEIREMVSKLGNTVDVSQLTQQQMIDLGFRYFSEDSDLLLIPLWLYPFLEDDIKCIAIDGKAINEKSKIDTDHRYGMLAFGINVPRPEGEV